MTTSPLRRTSVFLLVFGLLYGTAELANYFAVGRHDYARTSLANFDRMTDVKGVILGDSHAGYGIDPQYLDSGWYNFSSPGDNLVIMYLKLKHALARHPEIRFVVLPIDWHILSAYRHDEADYSKYYAMNSFGEWVEMVGLRKALRGVIKYYLPLTSSSNRSQFVRYLFSRLTSETDRAGGGSGKKISVSPYGHVTSPEGDYLHLSDEQRAKQAEARIREQFQPPLVTPLLVRYFDETLQLARTSGAKLIAVRYPVPQEYLALLPSERLQAVAEAFDRRASLFSAVLDYSRRYEDTPEFFLNADHLGVSGSRALSQTLRAALREKGMT